MAKWFLGGVALLMITVVVWLSSSSLDVRNIKPPIPASSYRTLYKENAFGQHRHEVIVPGGTRSYQAYAPGLAEIGPRPAILLLHGAQRSGVSLVEKWKIMADRFGVVLLGPHGLGRNWSYDRDGGEFLEAVLRDAKERYLIDPNSIYLFGHSAGANFALELSVKRSNDFAAMAIHAGAMPPTDFLQIGEANRHMPVAIFIGTDDQSFSLPYVRQTAEAFAYYGHATSLYVLEGHNHWYYDLAPYINDLAWAFLSQYKLQ